MGNTTSLVMNMDISNGFRAPAGPSRVRVPVGEKVVMSLPSGVTASALQWTRDGVPIAGATSATYAIPYATTADAGAYRVTGFAFPTIATGIDLDVGAEPHLSNMSARVELTGGNSQIVGFVVSGTKPKSLLFRVVGPTLRKFGITSPAQAPRVVCYDANGKPVGFIHPAVVIDVNALFQSVGAFPVDSAELSTISYDDGPFTPGAYTLVVSDSAKAGGTALVEIYEFP
jgi:hypothetical protein